MIDSISSISALTGVSGTSNVTGNGVVDGGMSTLRANATDAGRQPEVSRTALVSNTESVSGVGGVGIPAALSQPLPLSFLNKAEGTSVTDLVNMQMGLMNYSMSMTIMAQSHKKISESKSALMNEGKNA